MDGRINKMYSLKSAWKSFFKHFLRYYEKVVCYMVVFILTPFFFIFEMTIVRPKIVEVYSLGLMKQYIHTVCPTFLFINVTGNMLMSIVTDTTLWKSRPDGIFCEYCSKYRPPSCWHCKTCNKCVLRRDHHCFFFSRCVGLYNRRYYVAYLGYIMLSMLYSIYYNYYFICLKLDEMGLMLSMLRLVNPLIRFMASYPMGANDLYALLWVSNGGLLIWSFALFYYHMRNVLKGVTARESRTVCLPCLDWPKRKENLVAVFGTKWYWAMLCPFVHSPLPESVKLE